ncbi:unnamed protein product [Musa textilis]
MQAGDPVPLYANKVGPFHSPSETYRFFDLPFCIPDHVTEKKEALGEVLNGDRLVAAPYKLDFRVDYDSELLCKKKLTKGDVAKFRDAVMKDYYFQMYYDDLPIWGFIGKVDKEGKDLSEDKYYLYRHIHFDILYNNGRVIEITVHTITNGRRTLAVTSFNVSFFCFCVPRADFYSPQPPQFCQPSQHSRTPRVAHVELSTSFSKLLSFPALGTSGFVRRSFSKLLNFSFYRYADDEESAEDQEETGWKDIHGDVFRFPKNKSLLAASLGSGTQLFALTVFIFVLALVGVFYPYNRGALFTALVVICAHLQHCWIYCYVLVFST